MLTTNRYEAFVYSQPNAVLWILVVQAARLFPSRGKKTSETFVHVGWNILPECNMEFVHSILSG